MRGRVNRDLTADVVLNLGRAFGSYLGSSKTVVVGRDPRTSGIMFSMAAISGLNSVGVNVIDIGMVPTPALCYLVPKLKTDGGFMITASHNPPEWNGVKVITREGTAPLPDQEIEIERIYFDRSFKSVDWSHLGQAEDRSSALGGYVDDLVARFTNSPVNSSGLTIAIDGGGGANSSVTPSVLRRLGCGTRTINCVTDGFFSGRPPEPKIETLTEFARMCAELKVDFGVAHDGDGDRAVFVDGEGKIYLGDRTFALNCYWALREKPGETIVTNIATSSVIHDVAEVVKAKVELTPVGEPRIVQKMKETKALVGGEENGSFIWREWSLTRDGVLACVAMLDLMTKTRKSLPELDSLFPKRSQVKAGIDCSGDLLLPIMRKIKDDIPDAEEVILVDGIRLGFADREWVLIRPSGTEHKIRVFSEASTDARAQELNSLGMSLAQKAIEELAA